VPPPGVDHVEIAEREINQWIAAYKQAYEALDGPRVKQMNPLSSLKLGQYKSATIAFSNVDIQPSENGQSAVLKASVQYQFGFRRGDPQTTSADVTWRMSKTPAGWVVER
jgi:hypothetical protein